MGRGHVQLGGEATGSADGVCHDPLVAESLVSLSLLILSHVLSLQNLPLFDQLGSQTFVELARIWLKFPSVLVIQILLLCPLLFEELHLLTERHKIKCIWHRNFLLSLRTYRPRLQLCKFFDIQWVYEIIFSKSDLATLSHIRLNIWWEMSLSRPIDSMKSRILIST